MIRAVFFDVGNTLIYPYPSVGEIYSKIALKYGMSIDGISVNESFRRAMVNRSALPLNDRNSEKQWWKELVWETISSLCRPKNFDSFFNELYGYFIKAEAWRLYPDVIPSLNRLKGRGTILGIISNWDSRLPPLLDNLELSPYFLVKAVSSIVGSAKPDPYIFRYALKITNVAPEEAIHIGDSVELDFKGARDCGMRPLLLNRTMDLSEKPINPTIHSLDDLFSYLS
jgi:putative hydrolase of the HAD superfamily